MEVILIYECSVCDRQEKSIVSNVTVREHLQLQTRMPKDWTITLDPKDKRELYICNRHAQEVRSVTG